MQKPRISAIAAIGRNRELGKSGQLLWRISADLKRVKELTMGHPLVMGRKTYESIGRPLPGRTNIVVTRQNLCIDGVLIFDSLEKAIEAAKAVDEEEIFIFGGAEIYTQAMPFVDRLYLTIIDAEDAAADTFFPDYTAFTKILSEETHEQDGLTYSWQTRERE